MLRALLAVAPPIALVLVGVLLVEPPYLTPADRVPTLRLLIGGGESRGTPAAQLRAALLHLLGPGNRGGERVGAIDLHSDSTVVRWRLNRPDQLSLRRTATRQDVYALLQWALIVSMSSPGSDMRRFRFVGSQEGSSERGTQSERRVIELTYSAEQIARIDWDTFSPRDVYSVADTAEIDPLLR